MAVEGVREEVVEVVEVVAREDCDPPASAAT
jgi:hypothetical protein